ncbi:MAG: peptidoglycan DD-metalloendopeptidase family protein [bacterium]
MFKIFLRFGGKRIILSIYQTYLLIKRFINKIFLPAKNKFLYPFVNKETIHFVVILLSIVICAENIKIKISNAESTEELLSRGSIISQFATEELGGSVLIEEKVSNSEILKNDYIDINSFAVKQGERIGTSADEFEEEFLSARMLLNFEGLVKPDITSTTEVKESQPTERNNIVEYIVQAGDVIGSIAAKFSITVNTILWSNNLSYYSVIRPGDKLKIMPISGVLHKVASGETLSAIANKYNADLEKIKDYNILANANSLQKGQEIIIPDGVMKAAPQAVAYKTAPHSAPVASSRIQYSNSENFIWPTTSKRITQYYHWGHHAIDVGGKIGTPIYSIEKGQIIFSGWSTGYGYNIIVDHGGGQKSRYAHFSKLYVKKSVFVGKGQQIGEMGSTGWSTGPHLHLEIIINGIKVNPLKYVK